MTTLLGSRNGVPPDAVAENGLAAELQEAIQLLRQRFDHGCLDALERGDLAEGLLHYLRLRDNPKLPFSASNLDAIPELVRTHDPQSDSWDREVADCAIKGRLLGGTSGFKQDFSEIDRSRFDYVHPGSLGTDLFNGLCRHRWMPCLARSYWRNHERLYLAALTREWDFFVERVPWPTVDTFQRGAEKHRVAPPFELENMAARLSNWYWGYWLGLFAEEMSPERNMVLLARCLRLFDLVASAGLAEPTSSAFLKQTEALFLWSSALPEVHGMRVWRQAIRNSCESALERIVLADGCHCSRTMSRQLEAIERLGRCYLLGLRNGARWGSESGRILRRMGDMVDALVTPDGGLAGLADSDRYADWRGPLSMLKSTFPDTLFSLPTGPTTASLWSSDGYSWNGRLAIGEKPSTVLLPQGGLAVVRSGFSAEASMLVLQNGINGDPASHRGNLAVQYEAFGQPILVDPGQWVYGEDEDRFWVTSSYAHNTVLPEGAPPPSGERGRPPVEAILHPGDPRLGPVELATHEEVCKITSLLQGYTAAPASCVSRTAVISLDEETPWLLVTDQIEDGGKHLWTNSWLIPASTPLTKSGNGWLAVLDSGLFLGIAVMSPTRLELHDESRFWCPSYGCKLPARWLRFSAASVDETRVFAFLVSRDVPRVPKIEIQDGEVELVVDQVSKKA